MSVPVRSAVRPVSPHSVPQVRPGGALRPAEIANAGVFSALAVVIVSVGTFLPHLGVIQLLSAVPFAIVGFRNRVRAVVAATVAAGFVAFLVAGAFATVVIAGCAVLGGPCGIVRRRGHRTGAIALLAAGMAGQAAAVLHGADLLPGWGEQLWDTSFILSDDSFAGRSLHALIGYSARPSGIQLAAYLATLLTLAIAARAIGRPRPRTVAAAALLLALVLGVPPARAADLPVLVFHNHRFEPARIEVPAHVKFKLLVKNTDDTADEFESADLNREKLVTPGQTITVFLGPLDPGEYKFFGDFHQDTAQGVLVAK